MPKRIGKYEIRGELGKGGFGEVYLGFDPSMDRLVAIKVLTSADPALIARFRTEAMAAGNLHHKNIVTVHEFGEDQGAHFLVMEHLEGRDLQRVMADSHGLTLVDKMRVMSQVAEGLQCAHQHGIVHRDVKPANVMLLDDGAVKIMDFGIARLTRGKAARLTQTGFIVGTISYMAPEQLKGKEADALCDIWAFGMIYYELLTGEHPFNASDPASAMYRILEWEPSRVRSLKPDCPEALDQVIAKLLSKDRDGRYQSLEDVLFDIAPILLDLESKQAKEMAWKAETLIREGQLEEAQRLIRSILAQDPMREDGRVLRQKLQTALKQRTLAARVDELRAQASERAAGRDYEGAIQALQAALTLDSGNIKLEAHLAELQAIRERSETAKRLLQQARRDAELNNLTSAFQEVTAALSAEPANAEAQTLLAQVQQRIKEREGQRKLAEGINTVRGLLVLESFEEAAGILTRLMQEAPGSPELIELAELARRKREAYDLQRRVRTEIDHAKAAMKTREFAAAIEILEPLASEPSCRQEVTELLAYARQELAAEQQAARIKALGNEAWALLKANQFEQATVRVEAALESFPENPVLLKLRQAIRTGWEQDQRRKAIQAALDESAALERADQLQMAMSVLETTAKKYPDDPALKATHARIREAWEQQQASRAALQKDLNRARSMLDQGNAASATQLLQQLTAKYPGEQEVTVLQQRALGEQNLAEQKRKELEEQRRFEAERRRREEQERQKAEAEHERAVQEARRRTALEQVCFEIRSLLNAQQWDRARGTLSRAKAEFESDPMLDSLEAQLRRGEQAEEKGRRLEAGRAKAEQSLKSLRFDEAIHSLQILQGEFPDHGGIAADLRQALDSREQHLRRETYAAGRKQADALLRERRFDEAIGVLERLLVQFPADGLLREDLKAAAATKQEQARKERYNAERRRVSDLVGKRRFDDAVGVLQALLLEFPNDPALQSDLEATTGAKSIQERKEALDRTVEQLERLYRKGDAQGVREQAAALPGDMQDIRVRELLVWAETQLGRREEERESAGSLRRKRRQKIVYTALAATVTGAAILIPLARHRTSPPVTLSVRPAEISFDAVAGGAPVSRTITLDGPANALPWSSSATDGWLSVQPRQGATAGNATVVADPSGRTPGLYSAQIVFSGNGDSEARVTVRLNLKAPDAPAVPEVSKNAPPSKSSSDRAAAIKTKEPEKKSPAVTTQIKQLEPAQPSNGQKTQAESQNAGSPVVAQPPPPPPPPPEVNCHSPTYRGLHYARFAWTGNLAPGAQAIIDGSAVRPPFPGCEIVVTPITRDVVVDEQPSRTDGFRRIKIRNTSSSPMTAVELRWEEK